MDSFRIHYESPESFCPENSAQDSQISGYSINSKPDYHPHSTEYCRSMSEIFPIFYCKRNIVATFLSNIAKYFIATLKFLLSEIFLKRNEYLIVLEIL